MRYTFYGMMCLVVLLPTLTDGQVMDTAVVNVKISTRISDHYIQSVESKSAGALNETEEATEKCLSKLKQQEQVLQTQLNKVDPAAANRIFSGSGQIYDKLQSDVKGNADYVLKSYGKYVPGIDSAITSLKFLQQKANLSNQVSGNLAQVNDAMLKVKALEDQFRKTDNVEDFIKQREAYLQQSLSSYNLPGLSKYQQQAANYSEEISELKQDWRDPSHAEQKAVTLLNKMPAYQDFFRKNSAIASLFNIPDDYSNAGIAGLQTKSDVQKAMKQQMVLLGPNGSQTAQKNIGEAQTTMSNLRDKLNKGSSDLAMPHGAPNSQHSRSIFRRLEYGINIQNTHSTNFFPTTIYFAGTVGYRINNKSSAGVGMSYNMGVGSDIQHVHLSAQGMGIRSYLDVQIKGSFFATGGYEKNYNKVSSSVNQLSSGYIWQTSGLLGISKIISLSGQFVKKTKVQLLWDMLSDLQPPKTQPFLFRLGYSF